MQYDVETPDQYLAALDHDWRRVALLTIRQTLKEVAPDWEESIAHKMLCYSDANGAVLHLNAQKAYVALYVGDIDALDPDGSLTAGINRGKTCLRYSKSKDVGDPRIRQLFERIAERRKMGHHTGA
ncbi:MAG: DUF1801 domain-containing protein [Pseudomonadota bacterium]